tara:strand:- start:48 stop:350 length:303 start_codon:yes stop_codon:yes gene_type:complete
MLLSKTTVSNIKEHETYGGVAFKIEISFDKEVICIAENSGNGGSNFYMVFNEEIWRQICLEAKGIFPIPEHMDTILCCCDLGDSLEIGAQLAQSVFNYKY